METQSSDKEAANAAAGTKPRVWELDLDSARKRAFRLGIIYLTEIRSETIGVETEM